MNVTSRSKWVNLTSAQRTHSSWKGIFNRPEPFQKLGLWVNWAIPTPKAIEKAEPRSHIRSWAHDPSKKLGLSHPKNWAYGIDKPPESPTGPHLGTPFLWTKFMFYFAFWISRIFLVLTKMITFPLYCKTCFSTSQWFATNHLVSFQMKWAMGRTR